MIMEEKILFIHNKATWYRVPFFNGIGKIFNIFFLFTDETAVKNLYSPYKLLKRCGKYPFSISPQGYLWVLLEDYSLIVLPPADFAGELFDFIIYWAVAKIRRKKIIVWSERWKSENTIPSLKNRIYEIFDEYFMQIISKSSTVCATSGGIKQKEYFKTFGIKDEKIFTIPYVSEFSYEDLTNLKPNKLRQELNICDKKVILYVGRLVKRKGVTYLIKAFAELKKKRTDTCLIIIGGQGFYGVSDKNSYSIQDLISYSAKLNLRLNEDIFFLGDIMHSNLPAYYKLCNVFVLPATAELYVEPWGLVINEAMFFGKPVIATEAVGAAHTLIKDGYSGFIIPEKNVNILKEKIEYLLDNPEKADEMGGIAKKIINENYNYWSMAAAFGRIIEYIKAQ